MYPAVFRVTEMSSRQRYDSLASCSGASDAPDISDVWEDFNGNGRDSDLDEYSLLTAQPSVIDHLSTGMLYVHRGPEKWYAFGTIVFSLI